MPTSQVILLPSSVLFIQCRHCNMVGIPKTSTKMAFGLLIQHEWHLWMRWIMNIQVLVSWRFQDFVCLSTCFLAFRQYDRMAVWLSKSTTNVAESIKLILRTPCAIPNSFESWFPWRKMPQVHCIFHLQNPHRNTLFCSHLCKHSFPERVWWAKRWDELISNTVL